MLAKTYPYRLREVYARALREKSWSASNIVEAIASSQLPRSRKIDDLMLGVETSFGWTAALKQLRKVDEQLASRLVVEGVRNGKELKLREIVGFANEWRIDELWNLLLERTKSADVGERLWSVFSVRRQGRSKNLFAGQKRYLLTMLDDATPAPDQKNNDEHNLQCYSVQNLAARVIGEQLGLPKAPMPRYSAEKWAVYRDVARKAIT